MQNPGLLSTMIDRVRFVNRERWFRFMVEGKGEAEQRGFFDAYPRVFSTSEIAATRNRLNERYRALIESNRNHIAGKRVLDLASHDGRWSLAAIKAGAKHVRGIEAREQFVEAARETMQAYGILPGQMEFTQGDLFDELDKLEVGSFDTVFCFGFFYHTIDHMSVLRKIARVKPTTVIIDTAVSTQLGCFVEVDKEGIDLKGNGISGEPGDFGHGVIGRPTKPALDLMLTASGYPKLRYYDWMNAGIKCWDDLKDYYVGRRVVITAEAAL